MENQTIFLAVIAVFVAVSAAALIFQAAMLYGTYKAAQELRDRIIPLTVKVDALVEVSRTTIDEARVKMVEIANRTNQILNVAKVQMDTVEEVLEDASLRTRRQMRNAEIVVEDALARAQETVAIVHKGILTPLRGINGVAAGVRAALYFLMRGTRPSPDQVNVDEEMFI
jgi:hypothetical protein